MIIDFKDLLLKRYLDNEFDIPMVAEVVDNGAAEINRIVETMLITSAAVKAIVEAGLDPMKFSILNRDDYTPGGILFFTAADEEWTYQLAGSKSMMDDDPIVDIMRKKPEADHWQIVKDGVWIDNGPPVGFLERINQSLQRQDVPHIPNAQE